MKPDQQDNATGRAPLQDAGGKARRPPAGSSRSSVRALLVKGVKAALFALVIFFVGRQLLLRFRQVPWARLEFDVRFALLAWVCVILSHVLNVARYRFTLACFHPPLPWVPMLTVAWVPMIAKYLPGKIASTIGAVWLLRRNNVPAPVAGGALLALMGMSVVMGLMLAVPLTLWGPARELLPRAWLWCGLLLILGLICLHPKVFTLGGNFVLRTIRQPQLAGTPGLPQFVRPLGLSLAGRIVSGMALWLIARSLTGVPISEVPLFVEMLALATTIGFLAFFAPAGLGVQEGLLLVLLGPIVGGSLAAVIGVVMRFLQVVTDVMLSIAGAVILRRIRSGNPP